MSDLLLPPGTRLLHIGPHKTGTTALQIAMGKNREAMLEQGVRYVWGGEHLNANLAALAVARRPSRRFSGAKPVPMEHWTSLVEKVLSATEGERVVISGEEFCSAPEGTIDQVVRDLGKKHIHVLITLRPLERIMASQWQQYVQAGAVTRSLEEWLESAFNNETDIENIKRFWIRHRHDALVHRWSERVGRDQVTVLILDERDKSYLYRRVEELLGLKVGTLTTSDRLVNRSLTMEEAESVRAMYSRLKEQGLGELADHVRFMISPSEVIKRQRTPRGSETRIILPDWARQKAQVIGREVSESIKREGVRIIGDLAWLSPSDPDGVVTVPIGTVRHESTLDVPVDLAGWIAYGVIQSSGISRGDLPPAPTSTLPFSWLRRATGPQLLREVARRTKIRLTQPLDWLRYRRKDRIDE